MSFIYTYGYNPFPLNEFPYISLEPGNYTVFFFQGVWGKSSNIRLCFASSCRKFFQVSVFADGYKNNNAYTPPKGNFNFREVVLGDMFNIEIGTSKNGKASLLFAEKIKFSDADLPDYFCAILEQLEEWFPPEEQEDEV